MKMSKRLVPLAIMLNFCPIIAMQGNEQKLVQDTNLKLYELYQAHPDVKQKPSPLNISMNFDNSFPATNILNKLKKTKEPNPNIDVLCAFLADLCAQTAQKNISKKTKIELNNILGAATKFAQSVYEKNKNNTQTPR